LTLSAFYFLRTNQALKAGICGGIVSATRVIGIFLAPAFLIEVWNQQKDKLLKMKNNNERVKFIIKNFYILIIVCFGLFSYMSYLYVHFQDPLLFTHVQSGFGAGRETGQIVFFYQIIWRYFKMFATVSPKNPIYFTLWLEFISSFSFLALLVWGYFKKIRPSYVVYGILCLALPTLTGVLSSMPRYVLVIFPGFIALAMIENKYFKYLILSINLILLFICTAMFTRGYWVS
ncbi:hypothetical protein GYA19_05670, partial [Candidatus Beckwithbacteria bacterium]|nr:hypothetical protein [Candidatus Beckwithbacteria bacterium]